MGRNTLKYLSLVSQLGLTIVIAVVLGGFAGFHVDRWLGVSAIFTLLGILLGAAGGMWAAYQLVVSMNQKHNGDMDDRDP